MRRVNVPLVIILFAATVVLVISVWGLHRYQYYRHGDFFLRKAHESQEEGKQALEAKDMDAAGAKFKDAIEMFDRYTRLEPKDADALTDFGMLLADIRLFEAAYVRLEEVLRIDPERSDVRRRLVDIAIAIRRYRDAREHLEGYLLINSPKDAELSDLLGMCQVMSDDERGAIKSFESAIKFAPHHLGSYHHLAIVVRRKPDGAKEADGWIDKMVANNAENPEAYLLRGEYLRATPADTREARDPKEAEAAEAARLEKGKSDAAKSIALMTASKKPVKEEIRQRALLLNADVAMADKKLDEARKYAQEAVKQFPKSPQAYISMCYVELLDGKREEGIGWIRKGLTETDGAPELLFTMADFLIDDGQIDDAIQAVDKLSLSGFPETMVTYLRGKIDFKQENWNAARGRFEQALPALQSLQTDPWYASAAKNCSYLLGMCYRKLGNVDQQIQSMNQAVEIDSDWGRARAGRAQALVAAGQIDQALQEYEKIMRLPNAPPQGWLDVANLLILQNRRRPESARNWQMVDEVLDRAAKAIPDSPSVTILRAEALIAQKRMEEAERMLVAARGKTPDKVELWIATIRLAQRQDKWDEAERLLDEATKQLGDRVALRLTRAEFIAARYKDKAPKMLRKLDENTKSFSEREVLALWGTLAQLARQTGDTAYARELSQRVAAKQPNDLSIRLALFELANQDKDLEGMKRILDEIQQIEGQGAYWHLGQAILLVRQHTAGRDELYDQALKHLAEARVKRPTWSLIPTYTAKIYDQRGDVESAIRYYSAALEAGDRDPLTMQRLVVLQFLQHRYEHADNVLTLLSESRAELPMELNRIWVDIKRLRGQYDEAIELGRRVAANSKDYRDHVQLGMLLQAAADRARKDGNIAGAEEYSREAETALIRGVEHGGAEPEPWVQLVTFYARTDKKDKAQTVIAQARQSIPADKAPTALARCYEAVGDVQEAARLYESVLAASPKDSTTLCQVGDFYMRAEAPAKAEPLLRKVLEMPGVKMEDLAWARRRLALALFMRGDYRSHVEALDMIEKNLKLDPSSLYDQQVRARILAAQSTRKQRQNAIAAYEKLLKDDQQGTGEDRFVLSRLYLVEGDWSKAGDQMRKLLAANGDSPRYVEAYIQDLLNRGEGRDAGIWVERLVQLAPKEYVTASLRARVLAARGDSGYDEAVAVMKAFVDQPDARPLNKTLRLRLAAQTFEVISSGLTEPGQEAASARFAREAEAMLRQYVGLEPKEELQLAAFLARQGRRDEALAVAEHAWPNAAIVPVASTCIALLGGGAASDQQFRQVEKILEDALARHHRAAPLVLALAELRTLQKNDVEAEKLYREVVDGNDRNVVALNNLAVFLAIRKSEIDKAKLEESLKMINRAIEIHGPAATLLDSRGTVYIAMNRWENAISDLEEAVSDKSNPVRQFHLAQAYYGFGDISAAMKALKESQKLGLKVDDLQHREAAEYEKLLRELGRTTSSN